jgi:peptidyl-prolyl cis-trans isomerase A (cyclophilin A)
MLRAFAMPLSLALGLWLAGCGEKKKDLEPPEAVPTGSSSAAAKQDEPRPETVDGYQVIHAKTKGGDNAQIKLQAPEGWTIIKPPSEPDPQGGKFGLDEALAGLPGKGRLVARIRTDLGTLECTLFEQETPNTVANFVGLARGLRSYYHIRQGAWLKQPIYDGSNFHRVLPGFMIQGGDYLGNGSGRLGYMIPDEVVPTRKHDRAGQLCMANRGPNTNEAQFFVTDGPAPHLDGGYTIFGQCSPESVVYKIARVPQSGPPLNRPLTDVRIESVRIERTTAPAAEPEEPLPAEDVPPGRAVEVPR